MRCKARSAAIPVGIASIRNAAARPYRVDSGAPISVFQWTERGSKGSPVPKAAAALHDPGAASALGFRQPCCKDDTRGALRRRGDGRHSRSSTGRGSSSPRGAAGRFRRVGALRRHRRARRRVVRRGRRPDRGLIGPNGAGKTTLFNCLSRLYECERGNITFDGHALLSLPRHRIAALGIGRTFQNLALFGTHDRARERDGRRATAAPAAASSRNALRLPRVAARGAAPAPSAPAS